MYAYDAHAHIRNVYSVYLLHSVSTHKADTYGSIRSPAGLPPRAFTLVASPVQTQGTRNGFARVLPPNPNAEDYYFTHTIYDRRVKKFLSHMYVNTFVLSSIHIMLWFQCICVYMYMCMYIIYYINIIFVFIYTCFYMTWHRMNITRSWNPPATNNLSHKTRHLSQFEEATRWREKLSKHVFQRSTSRRDVSMCCLAWEGERCWFQISTLMALKSSSMSCTDCQPHSMS